MDDQRYREVFRLPEKRFAVLLSLESVRGIEQQGMFHPLTTPDRCIPLLPMLELSYEQAMSRIREELQKIDRDPQFAAHFPFDLVIMCALTWPTDYWPSLAIQWFEAGYPISEAHRDALQQMGVNKNYPQRLRHRVLRLLKQAAGSSKA